MALARHAMIALGTVMIACSAAPAAAQTWVDVPDDTGKIMISFDRDSIGIDGDKRYFNARTTFDDGRTARIANLLDCRESYIEILSFTLLEDGRIIESSNFEPGKVRNTIETGPGRKAKALICG